MRKRFLYLAIFCLFSVLVSAQTTTETYVEVLYFHGKQRCVTCKAIEKYTKEVINTHFASMMKKGKDSSIRCGRNRQVL